MSQSHKTRIAPTPSGYLHVGNVLSFGITTALARKNGATVLLRIDDMDRDRVNALYLQDIFDTLNYLGVPWNEGPADVADFERSFSQLHRMPLYREALNQLVQNKLVFACNCTRSQQHPCTCLQKHIPLSTPNVSWRLITNNNDPIRIKTYSGTTVSETLPISMRNFVVKKKDGYPAYQLTSVIDDLHYGVDLIVRGQDLWASTLAQQQLAEAMGKTGFNRIAFCHHPLITDVTGSKLSKSAGSISIQYLKQQGKSPAEIFTMITAMMGIAEKVDSWEEFVEQLPIAG
ncbi:glutamate--tRNA ligase family protein [Mucilaginibacter flavus]|uniref:glutamate--tRNA ligase family protein n=1 Tax=Mucilaginibacter flavus TaxID=931504 RepID=UPI0025B5B3AB|nr:glutamate--tRNA ligase family protein [Mucilaginibacter flavus]MDN3583521.1 glutamate--tRNA ligase family protein [Mucilaginibacter flavus]